MPKLAQVLLNRQIGMGGGSGGRNGSINSSSDSSFGCV